MEFYENRSKRPFIVFVWIAKTLRNWYRINRTRRIAGWRLRLTRPTRSRRPGKRRV